MNTARSPIASRPLIIFVGLLLSLACVLPLSSPPLVTEQPTEPALVVDEPAAVPSEAPTSPPVDIHVITPGDLPIDYVGQAGDQNSSRTASRKQAPGGDQFSTGLFERPFNAQTMDVYYPDLDIVDFSAYQDDTWLYVTIRLQGLGSSGLLSGRYGFELDLDTDGQGEFLVLAFTPVSMDWTTDDVQIWQDANDNIGNAKFVRSDPPLAGDGYEFMIFDQGQGNDPDAGWVRVSPTNPSQVEFAVKRSILDAAPSFICWTWAGSDSLNPALFDLNDYFTQEQAGSSIYDYFYYPLNELSEIDNTCRIVIGNQTIQNSLGICETVPVPGDQPAGCRPPPQGCGLNEYFSDITCRCEIFG